MLIDKSVPCLLALLTITTVIKSMKCEAQQYNEFLKATRDFSVDLFKMVSKHGDNTVLSPVSVSTMLALIQQGAEGNTALEFADVLSLDAEQSRIGYKNITTALSEQKKGITVECGNRVYALSDFTVKEKFKRNIEKNFNSDVISVNLAERSVEEIAQQINSWIKEKTHHHVEDLIEPHMISVNMIMIMINAIYFKGNWLYRFKEKYTKTDKFEISPTESISVSFMNQKKKFYTGKNSTMGVRWVELPFEGDSYNMLLVMPLKRHTLSKVLSKLKGEDLLWMIEYGDLSDVRLRVPKFKIGSKFSIIEYLTSMGLRDVFTEAANLNGISDASLHVDNAVHGAYVEIDEKGSTASAATVLSISRKLQLPETFRLDQPFLFFIIDMKKKIPLFAGKVVDPSRS